MRGLRVLVLTLIFALTLSVTPVLGYWTQTESQGSWDYHTHYFWRSPCDINYSVFEYTMNQTDFNRWSFVVRLVDYDVGGLWEIEKCQQLFNATLYDVSETGWTHKIEILVGHDCSIHLFGIKTVQTWIRIKFDTQVIEPVIPIQRDMDVDIHVWRSASDTLSITYLMKYDYTETEAMFFREDINKTVGSAWFSTVYLTEKVEKQLYSWGSAVGMIQGEKEQEIIGSGSAISKPYSFRELTLAQQFGSEIWRNLKSIWDAVYNALPENVQNFISTASSLIYDFGNLAYNVLILLWDILIPNLPLIFGAYGLYLIYLIFKSIDTGDWTILFDHFIKITSLFVALGNAVLSVIRTIISLIKWW